MFDSEPLQHTASPDAVRRAVESAKNLYLACAKLGSDYPGLGLALVSLAVQYQTGEFGEDIAEFERRVDDLLREARETQTNGAILEDELAT